MISRHSGHMIVEGVRPLSNIPCRQCLHTVGMQTWEYSRVLVLLQAYRARDLILKNLG